MLWSPAHALLPGFYMVGSRFFPATPIITLFGSSPIHEYLYGVRGVPYAVGEEGHYSKHSNLE